MRQSRVPILNCLFEVTDGECSAREVVTCDKHHRTCRMEEQPTLGERPRATVIYCPVASFLFVSRSTGRMMGPTERRRRSGSVPASDLRRLVLRCLD